MDISSRYQVLLDESGLAGPRESYCDHHLWVGAQEETGLWEVEGPSTGDGPRVKSWKLKAGCWPFEEELFRSGKGQANIEGEQAVCTGEILFFLPWGPVGWAPCCVCKGKTTLSNTEL